MTGFVYALQPIAAYSPVPMVFRHLLEVESPWLAKIHEAHVLSWSISEGAFGEWRDDLALVDMLFEEICPAVDRSGDFAIPAVRLKTGHNKLIAPFVRGGVIQ
jgi:hypothetical protein